MTTVQDIKSTFFDLINHYPIQFDQQLMNIFSALACLLISIQASTLAHCPLCNYFQTAFENPLFELSLDFAPLDRYPINYAQARVVWNSYDLGLLKPKNQSLNHFSILVRAIPGANTLQIVGVDGSQGIIIDNVKLNRVGNQFTLVDNGDFEHYVNSTQQQQNTFSGWRGKPQLIKTTTENKFLPLSTAALILPFASSSISQTFNFDKDIRFQTDQYTLTFDYAAQTGAPFDSVKAVVSWNLDKLQISPMDYEIHSAKMRLKPLQNENNILLFKGDGIADGFGLTISNIKLIAHGNEANLILNGDFAVPDLSEDTAKLDYLPGWDIKSKTVTIAKASHLNKWWPKSTSQVLTLDDGQNAEIEHKFKIQDNFAYISKEQKLLYTLSFNYSALSNQIPTNNAGQLLLNNEVITEFGPDNNIMNTYTQKICLRPGDNDFTFRAKKGSIVISDFVLKRLGLNNSITINKDFKQPLQQAFIPGWVGTAKVYDSQLLNENWKGAKAIKLTAKDKEYLSQSFFLDKELQYKTNRFLLELEMAPTEKALLGKPLAVVSWNGQDYPLIPVNKKVQKFQTEVVAAKGPNMLTLSGQGPEGLTIDNVKLTHLGSTDVFIKNGDFDRPELLGIAQKKVSYDIPGWSGRNIEIGFGDNYNLNWQDSNGQVLTLATKEKTNIFQKFIFTEAGVLAVEETNKFILSFDYAADHDKPLAKSGGQIFWNKKLVGQFAPKSYDIIHHEQKITVDTGVNTLKFKGAGGIQAYGVTITNIKLIREGSDENIIENGNFTQPLTHGWNSVINNAPLLNSQWKILTVARIDANRDLSLTQTFNFDPFYRLRTDKLNILIDYAVKQGFPLGQAKATCTWNAAVKELEAKDYKATTAKITVKGIHGDNSLKLEGEGISINNIRVIPFGSVSSILFNGDFEMPLIGGKGQKGVPPGWNGYQELQFGKAYLFSKEWKYTSGNAVTLTNRNKYISQIVTIDSGMSVVKSQFPFFTLSLNYASAQLSLANSAALSYENPIAQPPTSAPALPVKNFAVPVQQVAVGEVYWNNKLVATLNRQNFFTNITVKVDAQNGTNSLTIKRKNQGVVVSNINLIRDGLSDNIIKNSNFEEALQGENIPGWKGKASIDDAIKHVANWKTNKVLVLNKDSDSSISQEFRFDGTLRYLTEDFVVSFQYGVREGVNFDFSKAKMYWNSEIFTFNEKDHDLHPFEKIVKISKGNNNFIFESDGLKTQQGIMAEGFNIGYVCVRPFGSVNNILKNHDFDEPRIVKFAFGMITPKIPEWIIGKSLFLAYGRYLGAPWGWHTIIELTSENENASLMQVIKIDESWSVKL